MEKQQRTIKKIYMKSIKYIMMTVCHILNTEKVIKTKLKLPKIIKPKMVIKAMDLRKFKKFDNKIQRL